MKMHLTIRGMCAIGIIFCAGAAALAAKDRLFGYAAADTVLVIVNYITLKANLKYYRELKRLENRRILLQAIMDRLQEQGG